MKIIIISAFDPVPWDDAQLIRYGYLAAILKERRHQVSYITSSFFHLNKCQRGLPANLVKPFSEIQWHLIQTSSYKKNVSLKRCWNHLQFAFRLKSLLEKIIPLEKPNLILCAFPPIFSSWLTVKAGIKFSVPVVLDIQDLWPESMERFVKSDLLKFPLRLLNALRDFSIKNARAISGVSSFYLNFLRKQIGNKKSKTFPIGINTGLFYSMYEQSWKASFFPQNEKNLVYLGSSTHNRELQTILEAMKKLPEYNLIVAGKGSADSMRFSKIKKNISKNIIFTGALPIHDLINMLFRAKAGLILADPHSFTTLPSKAFYYMAANLPVITNIQNEEFLEFSKNESAVKFYPSGNVNKFVDEIEGIHLLNPKESLYREEEISAEVIYNRYADWLEGLAFI